MNSNSVGVCALEIVEGCSLLFGIIVNIVITCIAKKKN